MSFKVDSTRNALFVLREWASAHMKGERRIVYLNPDKTLASRDDVFSLSETIQDLFYQRSNRRQDIAAHLHQVFTSIEEVPLKELVSSLPRGFFETFSRDMAQIVENEFLQESSHAKELYQRAQQRIRYSHQLLLYVELSNALVEQEPKDENEKRMLSIVKKESVQGVLASMRTCGHFAEKEFVWLIAKNLAIRCPDLFCENLDNFSSFQKEEVLQMGVFLKEEKHRQLYQKHFSSLITMAELAFECEKYESAQRGSDAFFLNGGTCYAYTLLLLSMQTPAWNPDLFAKARYIQANYEMYINDGFYLRTGRLVLQNPTKYETVLVKIATRYNMTVEDLLLIAKDSPAITSSIGRAVSAYKKNDSLANASSQKEAKPKETKGSTLPRQFVAPRILQRLDIVPSKYVIRDEPIEEMITVTKKLREENASGKYHLSLTGSNGSGHAVYVSFSPPCFSDINDQKNQVTFEPRIRTYQTVEEMLDALYLHLTITYFEYTTFSLLEYTNITTSS